MSMENFAELVTADNPIDAVLIMNEITYGALVSSIVLGIVFIIFIAAKNRGIDTLDALLSCSFIGAILGGFTYVLSVLAGSETPWVSLSVLISLVAIAAISIIVKFVKRGTTW